MKSFVRTISLATMLLAGVTAFGAQISIGIRIGPPPPPRAVRVLPPSPAPEFMWVEGYWYPVGRHYKWHEGYWTRPPYSGARWVAPHHDGEQFFAGYWDGDHGQLGHDHHWDRDRDRDFRDREHGHERDHERDHDR
jgi:hypothetical protein